MVDENSLSSLRELFLSYYSPTRQELRDVLLDGIISVDTNVLLDLYRYTPSARAELINLFSAFGERLFIPYTVAKEYQEGRLGAVLDHLGEYDDARGHLEAARERAVSALNFLAKRRSFRRDEFELELSRLDSAFRAAERRVAALASDYDLDPEGLIDSDPIRKSLEPIFNGKVGRPLNPAAEQAHRELFGSENRTEVLPGDSDAKRKPIARAANDYLIWNELKVEVARRGKPILFVTSDDKADWVGRERGRTERPRRELVEEMLRDCGVRPYMMQPAKFLELSREALDVAVSPGTVEEASASEQGQEYGSAPPIVVHGLSDEPKRVRLARCCTPIPGDEIVGRTARGRKVVVHRTDCQWVAQSGPEVEVSWTDVPAELEVSLRFTVEDEAVFYAAWPETLEQLSASVRILRMQSSEDEMPATAFVLLNFESPMTAAQISEVIGTIPGVGVVARTSRNLVTNL
ncbi:PIN-like domain-containing protein [Jiangella gansuensis]|uniref:PIN-like domain-containing protein n=1 Tax=Jiangella gansuensis TaxID=281473 RepID=UPI0012FB79E5|nr:PIN-like domain-containing protein [Jiangella gansuensis]